MSEKVNEIVSMFLAHRTISFKLIQIQPQILAGTITMRVLRRDALKVCNSYVPEFGEKMEEVGEIGLAGGRVNDSFKRYAEEREADKEEEYPKDKVPHPILYSMRPAGR